MIKTMKFNPWTGTQHKLQGGRIENWMFITGKCLLGNIYDDPRGNHSDGHDFRVGNSIITSAVIKVDQENGTVETKNTIYTLGKPWKVGTNLSSTEL